jgi:hypothetical protein
MKPIIHPEHIVKSTRRDVRNVPDTDIYSFIFEREKTGNYPTEQDPKQIAFIDAPTGYEQSFSELKEKVNYLAKSLHHQIGIREHDVVCFFSKNHVVLLWMWLIVDQLPHRDMGSLTSWRCSNNRESNLHRTGIGFPTFGFGGKVYHCSSCVPCDGSQGCQKRKHTPRERHCHGRRQYKLLEHR